MIQKRNPLRIQAQNELLLKAYELAKGEGQAFPLETLFSLMDVDGKEQVLGALREVSLREAHYREMDGQAEEVDELAAENARLRQETRELDRLVGLGT